MTLRTARPYLVGLDIETTTEVHGAPPDTVPGLDPRWGAVTDVALFPTQGARPWVFSVGAAEPVAIVEDGITTLRPRRTAERFESVTLFTCPSETELLKSVFALLGAVGQRQDTCVVTWNGSVFDLPFLADRGRACGLDVELLDLVADPAIPVKYDPLPGHAGGYRARVGAMRHLDIAHPFKRWAEDRDVWHSLKPVAIAAGLDPVEVDRSRMHELSRRQRADYVLSDAEITAQLAQMLYDELDLADQIDQLPAPAAPAR